MSLFGGLLQESTPVLKLGNILDRNFLWWNGTIWFGFLWPFQSMPSSCGWCLGMLLSPRRNFVVGASQVPPCAFPVLLAKRAVIISFSAVVSVEGCGGILWLTVVFIIPLLNGLLLVAGVLSAGRAEIFRLLFVNSALVPQFTICGGIEMICYMAMFPVLKRS
jgi:hypothetical protein